MFRIILSVLVIIFLFLVAVWFHVTQPLFSTKQVLSNIEVDPARLEKHVRVLSETFIPRNHLHIEILDKVAAYIRNEFEQTNGRTSEQTYHIDNREYRNVILQLGPETNERIIVGAHYDAAGEFPGADDNASGVAGLIELAHLFDEVSLPMTIELVAYTLEEPPYFRTDMMGSAIHAKAMSEQGILIRMMISLEMIGYFSDELNSQHFPLNVLKYLYPSEGNWIAVIGNLTSGSDVRRVKYLMHRAMELPVYSFNAPSDLFGIDWSDHLNYWNNGYSGIMITDTSFLRNTNYHTEYDTYERLDYDRMSMVIVGVYEAVLSIALGDKQ